MSSTAKTVLVSFLQKNRRISIPIKQAESDLQCSTPREATLSERGLKSIELTSADPIGLSLVKATFAESIFTQSKIIVRKSLSRIK